MNGLALKREEPAQERETHGPTVGDLIAAAFDVAGDVEGVKRLLASRSLRRALHARVVLLSSHP